MRGIVLAAVSNTVAKGVLVAYLGGRRMGRAVGIAFAVVTITGVLALVAQSMLTGR